MLTKPHTDQNSLKFRIIPLKKCSVTSVSSSLPGGGHIGPGDHAFVLFCTAHCPDRNRSWHPPVEDNGFLVAKAVFDIRMETSRLIWGVRTNHWVLLVMRFSFPHFKRKFKFKSSSTLGRPKISMEVMLLYKSGLDINIWSVSSANRPNVNVKPCWGTYVIHVFQYLKCRTWYTCINHPSGVEHSGSARSIPGLLMPWLLASLDHGISCILRQ